MSNTILRKNGSAKIDTKTGGSYTITYSDLAAINEYCDKNKIKYRQHIREEDGIEVVYTQISENGGEYGEPIRGARLVGNTTVPKDYGASITYARRYSLNMALGLASEDNDVADIKEADRIDVSKYLKAIEEAGSIDDLKEYYVSLDGKIRNNPDLVAAKNKRKTELLAKPTIEVMKNEN